MLANFPDRPEEDTMATQSKQIEILSRLDELSRLEEVTTDPAALTWIRERKKELRTRLDSSS